MINKFYKNKFIKYFLLICLLKFSPAFALGGGGELVIVANQ